MTAFAIYRLPHEDHATLIRQTDGEPAEYLSCAELNGRRGFVVAPFQISEKQPLLLIRPDVIETVPIEGELSETEYSLTSKKFTKSGRMSRMGCCAVTWNGATTKPRLPLSSEHN